MDVIRTQWEGQEGSVIVIDEAGEMMRWRQDRVRTRRKKGVSIGEPWPGNQDVRCCEWAMGGQGTRTEQGGVVKMKRGEEVGHLMASSVGRSTGCHVRDVSCLAFVPGRGCCS